MRVTTRLPASLLLVLACVPAGAIEVRFSPSQPIIEPTQKGLELNFDLLVHNDLPGPLTLTKLEISYMDASGQDILRRELNGTGSAPNIEIIAQRRLEAGTEWLFFNPFPEIPAGLEPSRIRARLTFTTGEGESTEVAAETSPSLRKASVVVLPLTGLVRDWDGHDALSHHRRWNHSLPFLRSLGFASNGMRYAYDFMRVGGETLDAPVVAAADGIVVRVVMDKPDDGSFDPQASLADSNALFGNYLVVDHGGVYSLYGHLRQHSSTLAAGERVKTGEQIAAVGRSGTSDFPHLHFQLMDAPDMRGEGVPSLFRNFSRIRGVRHTRVREGAIAPGELVQTNVARK